MNPFLGVVLHALGGFAAGSFYIPFKRMRGWAWESYWLVGGVFSWLIAPWIVARLTCPAAIEVLRTAPSRSLFWSYFFGVLWGIGGLTFGLSMRYLGMSLGYALALGFCAAFGTIIPPMFRGEFNGMLATVSGGVTFAGVVVCLLGIAICGRAGMLKEHELSTEQKRASIQEFSFAKGVWVAIFAGVMSACMAFAIAAGKPIAELAIARGTPPLWQNTPVFVVILAGGFTTNFLWCVALNLRNRSARDYVSGSAPALATNYIFSAFAGIAWYLQFDLIWVIVNHRDSDQFRTMNTSALIIGRIFCLSLSLLLIAPTTHAVDSGQVRKLFAKPTRDYSSGPLWVWNDMLTEDQIRGTMRDLAKQQVKQVFVHPRPGMMTPYLGEDWFRLWKIALDEAKRLDMNVWIYDENSYPSGFAGGWVPELMPESRGRGLHFRDVKDAPKWDDKTLAVFRLSDGKAEDVTYRARSGESLGSGSYLVAEVRRSANSPWHGGRSYVDLLYPGVTEKFLEVTLEPYRRALGKHFGKRIPGSFTDEPEIRPAGGLPWTEDLPQQFQKRWGYSLLTNLQSLARPVGDWQRIRHNYYCTLNELFVERWAKPYAVYCDKYGLEMTGHYWEHEWPKAGAVPDNMSMYAWQQRPGIDTLMNQYAENTHAQFGNARAVRELGSIANQLGKRRTLCEVYGAGGWDLRFEDMKRIADWLGVLGVNTFNQHVSYVTIRGARKRDHPQSFSYHEPWWDAYHVSAAYLERLTVAASQGEQVNRILVIEPTTTAWMYQGDASKLTPIGESFFKLVMALEAAQVEYDLGCEDVIARHGSVDRESFRVGKRSYSVVVLPPLNENLNGATAKLLDQFVRSGGAVVACGEPASRIDGASSSELQSLASHANWIRTSAEELPAALGKWADPSIAITRAPDDCGILFHMRRQLGDGELLLLVNTSIEAPSAGEITSTRRGIERWDLQNGKTTSYAFDTTASGVRAKFNLPPSGSLLLFLSKKAVKPAPVLTESTATLAALGPIEVRRLEPNVLTLDYVDITAGGETRQDVYFYQANQFAWQTNGMPRNPWDSAVQFKDELISKKFPNESGFEASYKFAIEGAVPANLEIVIERPDLYAITCNGRSVTAKRGEWWLDKAFGRIALSKSARVGENVVTIKASPFTMFHEIEPAYVLGDFRLKPTERGFVIRPDESLALGKWNEAGHPFYSTGMSYRQRFVVADSNGRHVVHLPSWYGAVAKVFVNGKLSGHIAAPPWECDVTSALKRGENTINVRVIGTLKNTLGPHHGNPVLGAAWPGNFQRAPASGPPPGAQYSTVGYGLFAPFELKRIDRAAETKRSGL